jgi:CHAT domain-containing protein
MIGSQATEEAFKRLAPGRRVLHLATHGFFLNPSRCLQELAGSRGIGGLELGVRPRPRLTFDQQSPLLLSGLALAAANRRSEATPHEEDGILTAEEVASLDLRGVEWAVLSACDTGVSGDPRGEGILGLRRAFQTAGVATLVISLWPVQDEAAREWMRALYQSRFHNGVDTAHAVRAATLEVLRNRRAQGRSTNPFFWAAFVAAGDWE